MNKRCEIVNTAIMIMCLVLAMLPLSRLASVEKDPEQEAKRDIIAQALSIHRQHERQKSDVQVACPMDIEDAWAIEDTRREAGQPLICAMHSGMDELGYDMQSRTFYCTIGMQAEEWPQIRMSADGGKSKNLRVAWIDDYTYDDPLDALREGYRYELLAYTDTEYEYIGVVFTGLPIVTLHIFSEEEVGDIYVPARVSVADAGHEAIDSAALTHLRGGGYYKGIDKFSYRIEFHDEMANGRTKKRARNVLGMEADTDWLLLSNAQEESALRNYLTFDLWNRWNAENPVPMMMDSRLIELFVNDEYMGMYQIMQRVNARKEIERIGGSKDTDGMIRLVSQGNMGRKPTKVWEESGLYAEYRYGYGGDAQQAFDRFEPYAKMSARGEARLDDAAFAAMAEAHIDIDSLLNYYVFMQACGLADNALNNLFIWMLEKEGKTVYNFSAWDMDNSLQEVGYLEDGTALRYYEERMLIADRILDLNLMNSREKLWKIWREKWDTVLAESEMWNWIIGTQEYVNASGADLREFDKWRGGAYRISLTAMYDHAVEHLYSVEETFAQRWPILEE